MNKRKNHDFDDGFDEESLFEDEEYIFERTHKWREHRSPARSPTGSRESGDSRHSDKPARRRELTSSTAWGSSY